MSEPGWTAPPAPSAPALRAVAEIGPFFAVRTDRPGPAGLRAEGYVPLVELYATGPAGEPSPGAGAMPCGTADQGDGAARGGDAVSGDGATWGRDSTPGGARAARVGYAGQASAADRWHAAPPALRHRYATVARRLGTDEVRVAASLSFQGLAGRLWSLAVGCAVLTGHVPDLGPDRLWWHPEHSAPRELWLPTDARTPAAVGTPTAAGLGFVAPPPASDLAERVRAVVVDQHLTPLHRVATAASGVSGALLWGNAGSALAGALGVLRDWLRVAAREGRADGDRWDEVTARERTLSRELFATEPLRSTGHGSPHSRPPFRRTTCCLYYRVPGGGLCGDCVLPRVPAR
ncbi:(2Fe-2S)-binding protein [Streptomyces sp. NPDC057702]|uniref:(2Fe-2S)-binding protein n=1 Tax=unclassified Streptomyces TaxID=2593676 RepID=UPI0036979BA3